MRDFEGEILGGRWSGQRSSDKVPGRSYIDYLVYLLAEVSRGW